MRHGIGERIQKLEKFTSVYEKLLFERHQFAYEKAKTLVEDLDILEIGCGTGYGTMVLAKEAHSVVALDIDTELIAELSNLSPNSNIQYLTFDGKNIPFPKHHFSFVFFFQVLEHVKDDKSFLNEIKRILHPNGKAIFTTPNRLIRLRKNQKPFNNYHYREYAPKDLLALADQVQLELDLFGIFGDIDTQNLEKSRLKKYQTWYFRHIFQNFPKPIQILIKSILLKLPRKNSNANLDKEFSFFQRTDDLEKAIDLWGELSHPRGEKG